MAASLASTLAACADEAVTTAGKAPADWRSTAALWLQSLTSETAGALPLASSRGWSDTLQDGRGLCSVDEMSTHHEAVTLHLLAGLCGHHLAIMRGGVHSLLCCSSVKSSQQARPDNTAPQLASLQSCPPTKPSQQSALAICGAVLPASMLAMRLLMTVRKDWAKGQRLLSTGRSVQDNQQSKQSADNPGVQLKT